MTKKTFDCHGVFLTKTQISGITGVSESAIDWHRFQNNKTCEQICDERGLDSAEKIRSVLEEMNDKAEADAVDAIVSICTERREDSSDEDEEQTEEATEDEEQVENVDIEGEKAEWKHKLAKLNNAIRALEAIDFDAGTDLSMMIGELRINRCTMFAEYVDWDAMEK